MGGCSSRSTSSIADHPAFVDNLRPEQSSLPPPSSPPSREEAPRRRQNSTAGTRGAAGSTRVFSTAGSARGGLARSRSRSRSRSRLGTGGSIARSTSPQARRGEPERRTTEEEERQAEIERLQRDLRLMESIFGSLLGQAFQHAMRDAGVDVDVDVDRRDGPNREGGAPPASSRAIRQLPTVVVTNQDLYDESNRECCICFGDNHLGDKVARMPCGHLYHRPCISEWLRKHCTCPICRFELETDDPSYERGRLERMKHRKPRYHKYELERMSIKEIRGLVDRLHLGDQSVGLTEKSELVDLLIASERIDLISTAAAPPLASYTVSELRALGVGKLKKAMAASGVFFDPLDVVEKEDMVQIFLNSGRLNVLPEEGEGGSEEGGDVADANGAEADGSSNGDVRTGGVQAEESPSEGDTKDSTDGAGGEVDRLHTTAGADTAIGGDEGMNVDTDGEGDNASSNPSQLGGADDSDDGVRQRPQQQREDVEQTDAAVRRNAEVDELVSDGPSPQNGVDSPANETLGVLEHQEGSPGQGNTADNRTSDNEAGVADHHADLELVTPADFASHSISQLRAFARELGVDVSDCLERSEMVSRVVSAAAARMRHS